MRLIALAAALVALPAGAEPFILIQSTTSTQNSGLYETLLPQFTDVSGIEVRVVAVGTGQALKNAANCDGDVVIVHARAAEAAFVDAGYGLVRHDLMYNDFVLVGPAGDPAEVRGRDPFTALTAIAQAQAPFASRADDSGTHQKEMSLWETAGLDPMPGSGDWYLETGSGMGATLNIAVAIDAYTMTDRATWIAFGNKGGHEVLVEGDPALFNQYGVIAVNPAHCPQVKAAEAETFIDWLLGEAGQAAIGAFERDGQQLFFPNANG